jgi:hypothetical protein
MIELALKIITKLFLFDDDYLEKNQF